MRRSVVLLSTLLMIFSVAPTAPIFAADSFSIATVSEKRVVLSATTGIEQVRYFTLDSPQRLVVDLYGVAPGEHADTVPLNEGFKQLRVGPLDNKTRFVFDVDGSEFPTFNVKVEPDQVIVTWEPSQKTTAAALAAPVMKGSAKIVSIDFDSEKGQSKLNIVVDGTVTATEPTRDGDKIQFSLKNTTLPRALRREFDTLAFPSAIYSATPYLVNSGGVPAVRFVVQLKADQPYRLEKEAAGYVFIVDNGPYDQATPPITGILPVPAKGEMGMTSASMPTSSPAAAAQSSQQGVIINKKLSGKEKKTYTGAKTSLVFDNADVRDILRLIAEISNLNIIASDEVKGNITLRLIDVPWDQALDLILDVSGLGMVREGNVVRVLPKDTIRSMKEAELTAVNSQEKLEPLATEVVTVSYADLGAVAGPVKEILSDRGNLTPDSRNKYLIITDVPKRIAKAKELISILDTPERQVMIEARIVEVSSSYSRDLGINWGINYSSPGSTIEDAGVGIGGDFLIDLPDGAGSVGEDAGLAAGITFGEIGINKLVLDLRISALEANGKAKIVSLPKVTTLNGETAKISQGTSIPYQTTSDGGTTTEFVNAELKLEVTPVINPDDSIIMEIVTTNDSPSITSGATAPSIDTKQAETKVLVHDGETTVIGGIFVENNSDSETGTPWLMELPILGHLFKSTSKQSSKSELLVFITPRILKDK